MDWLIPRKEMNSLLGSGRMSVLKRAATDVAYSMETCRSKFICNPPTLVQGEKRTDVVRSISPFVLCTSFISDCAFGGRSELMTLTLPWTVASIR